MFASKNDWSKWTARQEFDWSSPWSGQTLSIDRPLFWALKTWGKTDGSKKPKQQLYLFPREGHIFLEIVKFYSSLKSCNRWVLAHSRVFWIYLSFLVMLILRYTSLKFRVSAYSQDRLIAKKIWSFQTEAQFSLLLHLQYRPWALQHLHVRKLRAIWWIPQKIQAKNLHVKFYTSFYTQTFYTQIWVYFYGDWFCLQKYMQLACIYLQQKMWLMQN